MSGRDSGVESGAASDSSESISMSVGSPARQEVDPESLHDNSEDLAYHDRLSEVSDDLDTNISVLTFHNRTNRVNVPVETFAAMHLPATNSASSSGFSRHITSHSLNDMAFDKIGEISAATASSNVVHSEYHQHNHMGKIRPGILSLRKMNCRRHRGNVYPSAKDVISERKLRHVANTNNVAAVRQLLDEGVDSCAADERQRTPLHLASCKGFIEVAKLLIQYGADLNQKDIVGNTPLHLAACTGDIAMVTLLLQAGTNINALDNSGRTPIHLAQSKLKLLQYNQTYSSIQLKMEVLEILEMMLIFLQRSGKSAEVDLLNLFSTRLHQHQTREEVDSDVKDLLSNLTHLSLQ